MLPLTYGVRQVALFQRNTRADPLCAAFVAGGEGELLAPVDTWGMCALPGFRRINALERLGKDRQAETEIRNTGTYESHCVVVPCSGHEDRGLWNGLSTYRRYVTHRRRVSGAARSGDLTYHRLVQVLLISGWASMPSRAISRPMP